MRDNDSITKKGWMITRLGLTGSALDLFALVYGRTQEGGWYEANGFEISEWMGVTDRTAMRVLSNLVDSSYIIRQDMDGGFALRVNPDIVRRALDGEVMTLMKRNTPARKTSDGVSDLMLTVYRREDVSIIIMLPRECDSELEMYERIFFFRAAADPKAEAREFVKWNSEHSAAWKTSGLSRKYWFATKWRFRYGIRLDLSRLWLSAWAKVYNWAYVNEPAMVPAVLNPSFRGVRSYGADGEQYELTVTKEVGKWLFDQGLLQEYINPLAKGVRHAIWRYV